MFSLPLSASPFTFLHFHGVTTEANGANSKVTGAALFATKDKDCSSAGKERVTHYIDWVFILWSPFSACHIQRCGAWQSCARFFKSQLRHQKWRCVCVKHVMVVSVKTHYRVSFFVLNLLMKSKVWSRGWFPLEAHVSIAAQSVFICWGWSWGGGVWARLGLKDGGKGGWWWWWNKHLEVTQVDSGLVCSLYQWGPGPWALGVYLSSWGTTAHYSPPIMPHRAPFLCLNWGAVCAPMNYSIYLLCCAEVCLEKLLQTPKCPRVHSLIYANSDVFPLIFLPLWIHPIRGVFLSAKDPVWFHC